MHAQQLQRSLPHYLCLAVLLLGRSLHPQLCYLHALCTDLHALCPACTHCALPSLMAAAAAVVHSAPQHACPTLPLPPPQLTHTDCSAPCAILPAALMALPLCCTAAPPRFLSAGIWRVISGHLRCELEARMVSPTTTAGQYLFILLRTLIILAYLMNVLVFLGLYGGW